MEANISPGFLVAAPHMRDPYFEKSVVFMMEHEDTEGSMGLVLNQRSTVGLAEVLHEMNLPMFSKSRFDSHPPVMVGGPVAPELGWILHSPDWSSAQTKVISDEISVTASIDLVEAIAQEEGPREYLLCLGYAGWGPGQLIQEIRTGAWLNVPCERSLVFDVDADSKWETAISRLGIDAANIVPMVGDA